MKRTSFHLLLVLILIGAVTQHRAYGQDASPPGVKSSGLDYRATVMLDIDDVGKKTLSLAQAMPPDKFSWRPAGQGFLSVSELYLQVATQYFHRPRIWGAIKAADYEYEGNDGTANRVLADLDKSTTDKSQVILQLVDAISYFDGIMKTLSDADLQKSIKVGGHETTPYASLLKMDIDLHEYLARASDYARLNGVVLPWMDERQQELRQLGLRSPRTP